MRRVYLFGLILMFLLSSAAIAVAYETSGVSPEAALKMLQEGNGRFVSAAVKRPNQNAKKTH